MKNKLLIALMALGLAVSTGAFAQTTDTKPDKKERKAVKKEMKGKHRKAMKKEMKSPSANSTAPATDNMSH